MKAANDDLSLKLRALSDPVRRQILSLLTQPESHHARGGAAEGLRLPVSKRQGMCAAELQRHIGLAQPTISHHMRILCEAGLVQGQKLGTWMWYCRDEAALRNLAAQLQAFCR
jgi:ArsR family transcriptional regulator